MRTSFLLKTNFRTLERSSINSCNWNIKKLLWQCWKHKSFEASRFCETSASKFGLKILSKALICHWHLQSTPKWIKSVVGWFRFRRSTPLKPSLREIAVHKRLGELNLTKNLPLIFGLITNNVVWNSEALLKRYKLLFLDIEQNNHVHDYSYSFYTMQQDNDKTLKNGHSLKIINLQQSGKEEYDFTPSSPIGMLGDSRSTLGRVISSIGQEGFSKFAVRSPPQVEQLQQFFQLTLDQLDVRHFLLFFLFRNGSHIYKNGQTENGHWDTKVFCRN